MFKLVIWDFIGKIANQVIAFIVSIILARILDPSEFGVVGIALALVSFTAIFYDFGLKASVIQADEISQKQLSTIFFLNLVAGIVLFGICYTCASFIEDFYRIPGLSGIVIAIGLLLIINATASLPMGLLARKLQFRKIATVNFIAAAIAGAVAVTMAYMGWGVWSLIANTLINAFIVLVGVFVVSRWKPSLMFQLSSVRPLWGFGSTVFGTQVLDSIFSRLDVFLIGRIFNASTLGFYTRAQSLDAMVKQFSSGSLVAVVLPYFSRIKNDRELLLDYFKQCLHMITFASLFLTGILYVISIDLFTFLFTAKWSFAGELFQIIALSGFAYPVSALMVNVILSQGKTKAVLRLELLKKVVLLPVFLFGFYGSIKAFLFALVAAYWVCVLLNAYFTGKAIKATFWEQTSVLLKYIVICAVAVIATQLLTGSLKGHGLVSIIISGSIFAAFYILLNFLGKTTGSLMIQAKALQLLKKASFKAI